MSHAKNFVGDMQGPRGNWSIIATFLLAIHLSMTDLFTLSVFFKGTKSMVMQIPYFYTNFSVVLG